MVAIRKKVGARGYIRTPALGKGKKQFKIDCSIPCNDKIWEEPVVESFEQYLVANTKLHGKKGKLADKVRIALDKDAHCVNISTTMKYRKKYFKYLTKKFLKKKNMREWFKVISSKRGEYQLRYFRIDDQQA